MYESNRKRSELEMSADILKVAASGAKKYHLVYQTNTNSKVIEKYIKLLKNCELLTGPCENNIFKTTDKGFKYLNQFEG